MGCMSFGCCKVNASKTKVSTCNCELPGGRFVARNEHAFLGEGHEKVENEAQEVDNRIHGDAVKSRRRPLHSKT